MSYYLPRTIFAAFGREAPGLKGVQGVEMLQDFDALTYRFYCDRCGQSFETGIAKHPRLLPDARHIAEQAGWVFPDERGHFHQGCMSGTNMGDQPARRDGP